MTRKNFEFSDHYIELLARLKDMCGLRSETSVVEEGLVLLGWAVGEVAKGNVIGAYDEKNGKLREITSTALVKAREWKIAQEKAAEKEPEGSFGLRLKT